MRTTTAKSGTTTTTSFGVQQRTTARATDVMKPSAEWGPKEVQDFVVRQIRARFGDIRRPPAHREAAIFVGFCRRFGTQAGPIAEHAFGPICEGRWNGAPIRVERFCANSDPYFADIIAARLG